MRGFLRWFSESFYIIEIVRRVVSYTFFFRKTSCKCLESFNLF